MKPQLQQYFKREVAQSSINLRLMEAVVQATLGSRVYGEVELLSRAEGCGQNLNDPWVETSAWFEVRVRRRYTIHQVDLSIDFGNIATGNRIAGNMVSVRVFAESGHSVRMAGSASVLAKSAGPETLTVPLLEDACGHQGRNATCVLTVTFHTPTAGNHIGDDIRSLAFLLNSAKFVSTKSQSNALWLH